MKKNDKNESWHGFHVCCYKACDSAHSWQRGSMLKAVTLCAAASAAAFAPTSVPQLRR